MSEMVILNSRIAASISIILMCTTNPAWIWGWFDYLRTSYYQT